ncbi:MAG TPA: 50S ribosomal protein L25 [Candidatus Saccharimonadales bacterium]|nr:50S ribosomal protein L25 [Candidatus Saccharimonadales bacterium]
MEQISVSLEKRDITGKAVKQLRQKGYVPAVIHDHGKDSIVVMGEYVPLAKAYRQAGKHHPVSITADGKQYMAIIKKAEFDPKKHLLSHIVFNAVKANEKVTTEVPVHIKFAEGNDASPAERAGLIVLHQLETVEVEAIPKDLPDVLTFDGEKLIEVGDQVTVADLQVPKGVVVKTDPAHTLSTVFEPSALQAANDAAGGDAEEVTETEHPEGETVSDVAEEGTEESKEEKK